MRFLSHFVFASAALALMPAAIHAQAAPNPAPEAVQAGSYKVETSHTRTQFTVSHMGFSDWYGDFTGTTGTLSIDPKAITAAKVDVTIPVDGVSTTNTKLDDELKSADWFDAGKFPVIHFVSTAVVPTGPRTAQITGNLTFHGVTRPVTLAASFNAGGANPLFKTYTIGFNATTTLNRSDFGVKTYVPLIGDAVTIRISAAFEKVG